MNTLRKGPLAWTRAIALLFICLALVVAVLAFVGLDVRRHLVQRRGVESGLSADLPPLKTPRLGVNVALEQYERDDALEWALEQVEALGFGTVRQRFPWSALEPDPGQYQWAYWDRTLPMVDAWGLDVIAVLDTSPAWARSPDERDNVWAPPQDPEEYGRFVREFAARYGDHVTAYQIWDQPNVSPHWGNGPIDPGEYVELLRVASEAIRSVDGDARIIAGGLAPNTEPRGRNMSDIRFLSEMYRYGAAPYFDVLGVKAYGFWSGPLDRRAREDVLNFSRVVLLRREMLRRGDGETSIWAMDSGWCALPPNWEGEPSPQGSDIPFVQARRTRNAVQRMKREWPWMGLMCTLHLQPDAASEDPVWGYALFDAWGVPTPLLQEIDKDLVDERVLYPGFTRDLFAYLRATQNSREVDRFALWGDGQAYRSGFWDVDPPLDVQRGVHILRDEGAITFPFWGTDLLLDVQQGAADGTLRVSMDDGHSSREIELAADGNGMESVHVAQGLPREVHWVMLQGTEQEIEALQGARIGCRRYDYRLWRSMGGGFLALVCLGLIAFRVARDLPWRTAWGRIRQWWEGLPGLLPWFFFVLGASLVVLSPIGAMRLLGLGLYGLSALFGPQRALLVAVACIPLAPLHVHLGPGSFSVVEVAVLVAFGARLWNALLAPSRDRTRSPWPPSFLDVTVCAFVFLAIGTSMVAEYRRVALRELRVMVVGPALFYGLLRTWPADGERRLRLLDAFWISALGVALYGLVCYSQATGVVASGGLRRARAFYGSPNNLALIMERALPLGLAMALWGRSRPRRWLYGLGAVPVLMMTLLTFSRAGWLLGLPASALVLLLLGGRRLRWVAVGLLLAGGLLMIPLLQTERFASLLDPTKGTLFLRLRLWQAAWNMIQDHPWMGVGLDNFLYYYGDYILPGAEVERWLSHPHNLLFDFWLRLGIGGVALLGGLMVGFLRRVRHVHLAARRDDLYAGVVGFAAGMAAFVAHGSVDSSYFVTELAYWFMFALAWVSSLSTVENGDALLHT
ncbi:MAG: O-antigen ligase family protein [Anaerolineales bacterium]